MDGRQLEIDAVVNIIKHLLADNNLTLGTRSNEPLIVKDSLTGKVYGIYAIKEDGESND